MKVSVIIPTLNAEKFIEGLLKNLIEVQTLKPDEIIIIDSSSQDKTVEIAKSYGCKPIVIKKEEFNHGGTRTFAGKKAIGDILVYFTQDAYPYNEYALENLIKVFEKDEKIACAYGRQIPYEDTNIYGKFMRHFNYPETSFIRTYEDRHKFGRKTVFFSNSFSAYKKEILEKVGWFKENLISYEDIYIVARFLTEGYKIAYVADAIVYHSHSLSVWKDFKRHFELGIFFREENWILKIFGKKPKDEGIRMIKEFIKFTKKKGELSSVSKFFFFYFLRRFAWVLGYNYKYLPKKITNYLITNKNWFMRKHHMIRFKNEGI